MNLIEHHIRQACLAAISGFELDRNGDICGVGSSKNLNRDLLNCAIKYNIMSHEEVLAWVTKRIFDIGAAEADWSRQRNVWADHLLCPPALAYALQHGKVPATTVSGIQFDHGDTAETFMRGRVDNLPAQVLEQLLGSPSGPVVYTDHPALKPVHD